MHRRQVVVEPGVSEVGVVMGREPMMDEGMLVADEEAAMAMVNSGMVPTMKGMGTPRPGRSWEEREAESEGESEHEADTILFHSVIPPLSNHFP